MPDIVVFAQGQNEVTVTAFSESMVVLQLCVCFLEILKMLAGFLPDHCWKEKQWPAWSCPGGRDWGSHQCCSEGYVLQSAAEVVFGCEVDYVTLEQVTACWRSLGHSIQTLLPPCLVYVVGVAAQPSINQASIRIFFVLRVPSVSVACKCMYAMLSKIGEERHERDLQVKFSWWWQLFFSSVGYVHYFPTIAFFFFFFKSVLTNSCAGPGFPLFDLGKNSGWIAGCLTMAVATLDVLQPSTAGTNTAWTSKI